MSGLLILVTVKSAMSVPWGDVSTAFYTTGIPNIEVFVPAFPKMIFGAKMLNYVRPVLKINAVQKFIKSRIEKRLWGQMRSFARQYLPMFGVKHEMHVGKSKLPVFKRKTPIVLP